MNRPVLFILIDAFRWDYLDPAVTPFLYDCSRNGLYVRKITPGFSFCERTEILTGTYPSRSGNFTAIGYLPDSTVYSKKKDLFFLLDKLLLNGRLDNRMIRKTVSIYARFMNAKMLPYSIPYGFLPYFNLTEDRNPHDIPGAFRVESLFDVLYQKNKSWFYDSFTALGMYNGDDESRIRLLTENITTQKDLYMLAIGGVDAAGHESGTDSSKLKSMLKTVDTKISHLSQRFRKEYVNSTVMILGDHGMTDVKKYINVKKILSRHAGMKKLAAGQDYLYFLDSTIARFWSFSRSSTDIVQDFLSDPALNVHGKVITPELADKYSIPVNSSVYGDYIWWADPGVVICPDFFHNKKKVRAMHGYTPLEPDSQGLCLVNGNTVPPRTIERADLVDICPSLSDLLDIPYARDNSGKSILT